MKLIIAIIIILIIIIIDKNSQCNKLLEENKKLKQKLEANRELTAKTEIQNGRSVKSEINNEQETLEQYLNQQRKSQELLSQRLAEEQKINREKVIKREKEQKNISILITGAICIVLSAIVFLMSTWNSIPNILKTLVLSLLTLVFFGGSYIAKEKFKLEKASKTFFYIAMAYIPICLISISIFGLFGRYLSIYGEGKHIYLMFASAFVAFIYYITYMNKNNKYILYGSLLSQVFSIVAFSLIFSKNILTIGINLLLYNILLMLITKKDIFIKVYNIIPSIFSLVAISMLWQESKIMILMLALLAINFLILELKNSKKIYSYMFNILLNSVGIYTIIIFGDILGTNISQLFALCFVVLSYIIQNMILEETKRENLINSLTVVTFLTMEILRIESFGNISIVTPYLISILQIIILIITYIKSKLTGKKITAILIPIYFIITGINIISKMDWSYHAYIIFAFITFMVGECFRKRDKLIHLNAFVISHILIVLTYMTIFVTDFKNFSNDIFYALLLMGIYIYSYLAEKNMLFKYLAYFISNFALFTLFRFFDVGTQLLYYIPMVSTLTIMAIESMYKEIQDEMSYIYLAFSKVTSFTFIYGTTMYESGEISTIVAIIFAVIIILNNLKNKNQLWNILPLTCVIPALFLNDLSTELEVGIMLMSVIATTGISLKEKKISIFTIFSGIYLFFTSLNIDSVYLKEILFICWSVANLLFITTEKQKDIFRFLTYVSILFLYNSIILDLELQAYTLFSMLGYVLIVMFTLRTIVIKYIKDIDVLEYIVFGYIYLMALAQYNNEADGMLFGILLVAIVITSYIKKYGALFMVSIFAILVNIFALTREFWFSVPWWGYLLAIGTTLIGFAIKNEISDKKSEINAIDLLKSIKDKIEK